MNTTKQNNRVYLLWHVIAIFLVSVVLNYVWELAQAPLYAGPQGWGQMWLHCFVASLGDGILIVIIDVLGMVIFKRPDWASDPGFKGYGLILASGLVIAIVVEWYAVKVLHRWEYSLSMPVIPGLEIGFVPVLQMLVLPPLTFFLAARWGPQKFFHK